ncbi:MAG: heparinase II/III-family protein [Anaerolineae bacterium]|nr:heparinase II/III-family protein [Anaerolineae bacterium]
MLGDRYTIDDVGRMLMPHGAWHPYATIEERDSWDALPEPLRKRLLAAGEALLNHDWPALPATLFLRFARDGNRSLYGDVRYARRYALRDLVLAECVEGEGRFLDDIVNGIWTTCEETYWGIPFHTYMQAASVGLPDVEEPTVDLFVAETVALLAWTLYLLGDRLDTVSPLVRPRILAESKRRVLDPCLARDDFWWMGFDPAEHTINNWNPWINSNWITAVLLLEPDADRRVTAIHKILRILDIFLGTYAEAGGCDEGPGYWARAAASLFDCLDLLHSATDGGIDVWREAKVQNMGRFIYRTHISGTYFVNFADASAINRPVPSLVYRYGRAIDDQDMMAFGVWLLGDRPGDIGKQESTLARILPALFRVPVPSDVAPAAPQPRDAWFDGIQVMIARDRAGSTDGFFVAAKGGHNSESHNHNDVGNFVIYVDGKPVIVDAGVETYRRQTFSPQRYEIWTMQSGCHTLLPTVDGVMQAPGRTFAARDVVYSLGDDATQLSLDLAGAYPPEAKLRSWQRVIRLNRGADVEIADTYELAEPANEIVLSVLTPCTVELGEGEVRLVAAQFGPPDLNRTAGSATLAYPDAVTAVFVERVPITDTRLGGVWGDHLNRVVFRVAAPSQHGSWTWRMAR